MLSASQSATITKSKPPAANSVGYFGFAYYFYFKGNTP
jgi:hypothetical protein